MTGALVLNGEKYNGKIIGDIIVCCDGGYDKCDVKCDLLVGDMDSITAKTDVECIRLNPIKDETDGEYGLEKLIEMGVDTVNFYGLNGGRLDHILANIGLMGRAVKRGIKAIAYCNDFTAYMINSPVELDVEIGSTISIAPFSNNVHIMSLEGFYWLLHDVIVEKTSSVCVSNKAVCNKVSINLDEGEALVIVNKLI